MATDTGRIEPADETLRRHRRALDELTPTRGPTCHRHTGHEDLGGPHHAHLTPGDATALHAHPPVDFEFIAARIHR